MFGKNYVMLSGEDLNCIVVWLLRLKEKFEDNGIVCAREIYDECVGKQESELNKAPVVPMIQKVPDIKMIDDSVDEIISENKLLTALYSIILLRILLTNSLRVSTQSDSSEFS